MPMACSAAPAPTGAAAPMRRSFGFAAPSKMKAMKKSAAPMRDDNDSEAEEEDVFEADACAELAAAPAPAAPVSLASYTSIVSLQSFDGAWKMNETMVKFINDALNKQHTMDTLTALSSSLSLASVDVLATAAALLLLRTKFPNEQAQWKLAASKATTMLKNKYAIDETKLDAIQAAI